MLKKFKAWGSCAALTPPCMLRQSIKISFLNGTALEHNDRRSSFASNLAAWRMAAR
jgi:hypothetical protein